jgi:hypothetical protein
VLGLVLSAGLVALVLGALGVSSASAATAPAVKVCKKLPAGLTGKGLWLSEACPKTENAKEGTYAWAENHGKSTLYCLLGGTLYAESLCESDNKVGPFLEVLTNEAFPKQTGLLLLSALVGHTAGIATSIHCEDGDFSGQPLTATLSSGIRITYLGCTVTNAGCTVSNPKGTAGTIETEPLNGLLESLC